MLRRILTVATIALAATAANADALKDKPQTADILAQAGPDDWATLDPENTLYIELASGRVVVALFPALAPGHVAQVKALARQGFYDGLSFYRVIEGFVAQGGDAFGGRPVKKPAQKTLKAEFEHAPPKDFAFDPLPDHDGYAPEVGFSGSLPVGRDPQTGTAWLLHCPGAFAFGRDEARDTASTEFYITLQSQRYLDRNLSVFGRVVAGMEHVDALRRNAPPTQKGDPVGDTIVSIKVAADVPEKERAALQILKSGTPTFDAFVEARRNRPEAFFYFRPNYVDICQIGVPVRAAP